MVIKDFFIISQSGNRQHCFWLMMRHTHIFIYTHCKYLHTSIMKNNGAQIIQEGMQETNNWLNMASFKRLKCVIPIPREVKAIEMLLVQGKDRDRGSWNWMTSRFSGFFYDAMMVEIHYSDTAVRLPLCELQPWHCFTVCYIYYQIVWICYTAAFSQTATYEAFFEFKVLSNHPSKSLTQSVSFWDVGHTEEILTEKAAIHSLKQK